MDARSLQLLRWPVPRSRPGWLPGPGGGDGEGRGRGRSARLLMPNYGLFPPRVLSLMCEGKSTKSLSSKHEGCRRPFSDSLIC